MEALKISGVQNVVKVGDTVSDIKEGKNAGVISVGILEGSSEMGLTQEEYEALDELQREIRLEKAKNVFEAAGADYVIKNMKELPQLIEKLGQL